jgi:hypothetical protein
MWDSPGGGAFGINPDPSTRRKVLAQIASARAILLCLDATDEEKAHEVFEHLPAVASGVLQCERFVVCFTKVDAMFASRARADVSSAFVFARDELLGPAVLASLQDKLRPDAIVAFGWSSVYGFLKNGEPNFDAEQNRLREFGTGLQQRNAWRPYGVLDPFTFIVADEHRRMKVLRASQLV